MFNCEQMLSDATMFYGVETSIDLFCKHSERPVYSYYYSHSHSSSLGHPYGTAYSTDDHSEPAISTHIEQ